MVVSTVVVALLLLRLLRLLLLLAASGASWYTLPNSTQSYGVEPPLLLITEMEHMRRSALNEMTLPAIA